MLLPNENKTRRAWATRPPTSLVDPTGMGPCDAAMYDANRHKRRRDTLIAEMGPSNLEEPDAEPQDLGEDCIDDAGGGGDTPTVDDGTICPADYMCVISTPTTPPPDPPLDNPNYIDASYDPGIDFGPLQASNGPGGNRSGPFPSNPAVEQNVQACTSAYQNSTAGKVVAFGSLLSFADNFWSTAKNWAEVIAVKGGTLAVFFAGANSAAGGVSPVTAAVKPVMGKLGTIGIVSATTADLAMKAGCRIANDPNAMTAYTLNP